jgi:hypothetical protein
MDLKENPEVRALVEKLIAEIERVAIKNFMLHVNNAVNATVLARDLEPEPTDRDKPPRVERVRRKPLTDTRLILAIPASGATALELKTRLNEKSGPLSYRLQKLHSQGKLRTVGKTIKMRYYVTVSGRASLQASPSAQKTIVKVAKKVKK